MKKNLLVFTVLVGIFLCLSSVSFAQSETFDLDVTIPASTSVSFVVWQLVEGEAWPDDPQATTDLSFSTTLTSFDDGSQAFLGNHYYAIDVAPNGAGQLNVLIEYADTSNPNGGTAGLQTKAIATVVKAQSDGAEDVLEREVLGDIHNTTILAADLETAPAGWMRMYVGLATGDPTAVPAEPAAAVPFNPSDTPGPYSGTITLTATLP